MPQKHANLSLTDPLPGNAGLFVISGAFDRPSAWTARIRKGCRFTISAAKGNGPPAGIGNGFGKENIAKVLLFLEEMIAFCCLSLYNIFEDLMEYAGIHPRHEMPGTKCLKVL